jgi:hypothetical protein
MSLQHIVKFEPGYDCIKFHCKFNSDRCSPGSDGLTSRSHGRYGLAIYFLSKGDKGVVQFTISTGWIPQFAKPDSIMHRYIEDWGSHMMPADLGYHALAPQYEDQQKMSESCGYLDGQSCYYDGSGLNASDAMYALVNGGEESLWKFMDEYYNCVFEKGKYPTPAEYPTKPRKID